MKRLMTGFLGLALAALALVQLQTIYQQETVVVLQVDEVPELADAGGLDVPSILPTALAHPGGQSATPPHTHWFRDAFWRYDGRGIVFILGVPYPTFTIYHKDTQEHVTHFCTIQVYNDLEDEDELGLDPNDPVNVYDTANPPTQHADGVIDNTVGHPPGFPNSGDPADHRDGVHPRP